MKLVNYILPFLVLIFVSCAEEQTDVTDNSIPVDIELIDQATFVKVFAEAQIIETHISVLRIYQPYYKDSVDNYYKALFEKYNTTPEAFYYTMQELSKDPKDMDTIITQSLAYLKKLNIELGDVEAPNPNLNALSRQQIGDIVYETPIKDLMLEAEPLLAGALRDTLFRYLDSFPEVVSVKGHDMESFRFSFVLNTNNTMMFNQLKTYLQTKEDKLNAPDSTAK